MEISVNSKNSRHLNVIRKNILEDVLKSEVYMTSYEVLGSEDQNLVIESDEEFDEEFKKKIIEIFKEIKPTYRFLYKGTSLPIDQLKSFNDEYSKIHKLGNVYYYICDTINEVFLEFAIEFVKHFDGNYVELPIDDAEIQNTLGLHSFGMISGTLTNKNDRLYFEHDGDSHHMDYEKMSHIMLELMKNSNSNIHYKIEQNVYDNIKRMIQGKPPTIPFYQKDDINFAKFKSFVCFSKLCKQLKLPMFNTKDLVEYYSGKDAPWYSYKLENELLRMYHEEVRLNNYREHEFDNKEEALAFCIYLSGFDIKYLLIEDHVIQTYCVSYVFDELLEPVADVREAKKRVLRHYKGKTDINALKNKSLEYMLSGIEVRDHIVFPTPEVQHISPIDKEPLPLYYYTTKGCNYHGIFCRGALLKGLFKYIPQFNEILDLPDVTIKVDMDGIKIEGKQLYSENDFDDYEELKMHLELLWKRGYLLTSYGLTYYLETGNISKNCIYLPEWFTLKNSNEENLYRFISALLGYNHL